MAVQKELPLSKKVINQQNTITKLIDKYNNLLKVNDVDTSKTDVVSKHLLAELMLVVENSDFKSNQIKKHNESVLDDIKKSRREIEDLMSTDRYYQLKKSEDYKYHVYNFEKNEDGTLTYLDKANQVLEQSKSNDIIMHGFRKALNPDKKGKFNFEFSKIFLADISNRIGHALQKEVYDIKDKLYFDEGPISFKTYTDRLDTMDELMKSSEANAFNNKKALAYIELLEKKQPDQSNYKAEYDKAVKVIKSVFPEQRMSQKFTQSILKSKTMWSLSEKLYDAKSLSMRDLWISEKEISDECKNKGVDPYEAGKLFYRTDIVEDIIQTNKGDKSCRVITSLNNDYEDLIKWNSGLVKNEKFMEFEARKHETQSYKIDSIMNGENVRNDREIVENYVSNAIKDQSNMTIFHLSDEYVFFVKGKYNLENINYTNNPYLKMDAFGNSRIISSTDKSKELISADSAILTDTLDRCCDNEEKYRENVDKFNKDMDMDLKIAKAISEIKKEDK